MLPRTPGDTAATGANSFSGAIDTFGNSTREWSIGIAPAGASIAYDSRGVEARTQAVTGSTLRVWSTYQPDTTSPANHSTIK